MRALRNDCYVFISTKHGNDWVTRARQKIGKLADLGQDQLVITNIIWHATHTDWCKYK